MRDYIRGFYGQFNEDSTSLGIHLRIKVWRATREEFFAQIQSLKNDIANAGGDWTGALVSSGQMFFKFGDGGVQDVLKHWFRGNESSLGDFETFLISKMVEKSPRKQGYNSLTEK